MKNKHSFLLTLSSSTLLLTLNLFLPTKTHAQSSQNPCFTTFSQADKLYLDGNRTAAEQLYRQCKPSISEQSLATFFPEPITNPTQLPPDGQTWWAEAQAGYEQNLETKLFVPLNQLIEKYPGFVPAYSLLSQGLEKYDRSEEALEPLEQAATLFPFNADIAKARVMALREAGERLEASIAARLFAIINPEHPEADEFKGMAEEDFKSFRRSTRQQFGITGGLGAALNLIFGGGNLLSRGLETAQFVRLLTAGEEKMGSQLAAAQIENHTLVEDPVIVDYVKKIGEDVANLMGRDEFDYEFYVIQDNSLNAFALPGGKVFVNTGAILAANSEAELAGLMAHEVAHAVLSHGYQQIARSNLLATIGEVTSLGNIANLVTLNFSRNQERQADILATRALAGYGYAADGLYNLFVTLNKQTSGSNPPEYLSTHPAPENRLQYIQALIQRNGYNRYSYEGVEEHARIQRRLRELL